MIARPVVIALALFIPTVTGCAPEGGAKKPAARHDALPTVEGLAPAEDEDPAMDAVRYTLTAGVSDVKLVEGAEPIQAWTYNGTVPGPLLQARVGDDVTIEFTNRLSEPTSIHWHGIRVPNAMDGVVHGDVAAIAPGESFTYRFKAVDAGTFWFHPHIRTHVQIERGLQGMFVIHEDDDDAPDVDADRAFVLDDVLLGANGEIAPASGGMEIMHGRYGNTLLTNGTDAVQTLSFAPGQVERWRLVNTANARTMIVRFPGLVVRHIGADGGLWPQGLVTELAELELPVGARAELEVRLADGSSQGTLQSVVQALDDNDNIIELLMPLAEVAQDDAQDASSAVGYTSDPTLVIEDNGPPTHTIHISGVNNNGTIHFTLNGKSWPDYEEWAVPLGELQIVEIINDLGMEHPFHLHGQFFQVVQRSGTPADDAGLRDTTLIRGAQSVRIATRFENPGMWMYHCHNMEHEENGMMGMVEVVDDGMASMH